MGGTLDEQIESAVDVPAPVAEAAVEASTAPGSEVVEVNYPAFEC